MGTGWTAKLAACLLALGTAAPARVGPARNPVRYRTYVNVRFGYAVAYPAGVLAPQAEADNGDGRRFLSADADAVLTVYGRYNVLDETLGSLYADACRGGQPGDPARVVTYHVLRGGWFVVSGRDGGRVFYEKTRLDGDVVRALAFVYPARRRSFYDPVAARIAASFRPLPTSF